MCGYFSKTLALPKEISTPKTINFCKGLSSAFLIIDNISNQREPILASLGETEIIHL